MKRRKSKVRKKSKKPYFQIKIAKERVVLLLDEADKMVRKDKKLAKRYVQLARKIGMRYNVRLTHDQKYSFCRHCHAYIKHGITSKNTLKDGFVNIKCLGCKKTMRYPYKNKK
ncbi:ribonuclease P protein component 4 [Candidatus Aenigmatarchaeota archaeon]